MENSLAHRGDAPATMSLPGESSPPKPTAVSPPTPPTSRLPKKQLIRCGIEAHTIQKCPSPKKKALDPLRYMPERASYQALFAVVACFEGHADEYHALRSYQQFRALHTQLQKKFPRSKLPKDLPSLRKKRFDNEYMEQKTFELNEYLAQLVDRAEVLHSKILRDFLDECPQSEASDDDDAVPTKMLDGLPGTIVSVRAGQSFTVSLRLEHAGDVASWQFTTKKHNIGFSATFNGTTVRVYSREDSQLKPVKGSFKCVEPGTLTLDWDNTYTWSKTKVLVYWAEVEQTLPLQSDAPSGAGDPSNAVADAAPMLMDGRRTGYIAQSRNPSLYPRQIMNTSLSLITKPFTWARHHQTELFKTGSLIVERNVKFRGRNWYRKWFVLNTRKCLLRYYDSEQASRKGLSLAKMNLATKNACLAITSQDEAAPTPFMFMVRSRKHCWKLCASSQCEYNEWEHAISTAILTAQLKRRSERANSTPQGETHRPHDPEIVEEDESEEDDEEEEEEDDDEHGKEDDEDEDTEDDWHESEPTSGRARDSTMSLVTMGALGTDTTIVLPRADLDEDEVTSSYSMETRVSSTRMAPTSSFCEHWIGSLQRLSAIKKALVLLWLNGLVYSIRSASSVTLAFSTLLSMNAYALVHALEAPPRRVLAIMTKNKDV